MRPGGTRGENAHSAKLNELAVAEIRRRSAAGESGRSLAKAFGTIPLKERRRLSEPAARWRFAHQ
jgi:hypothetical protein